MAQPPSSEELRSRIRELEGELLRMQAGEERLRLAIEAVNDGIFDFDLKTGETHFSDRYYTMLGYAPGALPACRETWIELLHPEDREEIVSHVDRRIQEGKSWALEFRMRARDGSYRWILGRGQVSARDEQGRPARRTGTHTDVTDRKEAELARQALIAKLNKALEEVKTLEGLIPICSACKKIRDDQGYWNQLERYFEKHSDALFSHCLCPACMDEMYGDRDWYQEMKREKKKSAKGPGRT